MSTPRASRRVRQSGLDDLGDIYRLAKESVFVCWDKALQSAKAEAPATQSQPTLLLPVAAPMVPLAWSQALQGVGFGLTSAELADLNANSSPQLYVFVRSAGSGAFGSRVAYGVNRCLSLSEIALPALGDTPGADKGYMGHEEFAVVDDRLVRRLPIYTAGDVNAAPSARVR